MHDAPVSHAGRHVPFKREGWGTALFVVALAVVTALGATWVHYKTYKHPTDVRMRAAGIDGATAPVHH